VELEAADSRIGVALAEDLVVAAEQRAAAGAGRLDGGLDDEAEQLLEVVRRTEGLAEAHHHVTEAAPLVVELADARLELVGHLVERSAEPRELVGPADVDSAIEAALGDVVRRGDEASERAHDRASLEVRDQEQEQEDAEHRQHKPLPDRGGGLVDRALRRQHDESLLLRVSQALGGEPTVLGASDLEHRRLARLDGGQRQERDPLARLQARAPPNAAGRFRVEREDRGYLPEWPRGPDDRDDLRDAVRGHVADSKTASAVLDDDVGHGRDDPRDLLPAALRQGPLK
jgi:hypothetical protein